MKEDTFFEQAATLAFTKLREAGEQVERLPVPMQTVIRVYAGQGIIDNGGLKYFYESDWPGNPPYSAFSEAYRRIGAIKAAECIEESLKLFSFVHPEQSSQKRNRVLDELHGKALSKFEELSDCICGDNTVWSKLESYVLENCQAFVP